jgi:hypothetical protein
MRTDLDSRIDAFWEWVRLKADSLRAALLKADQARDLAVIDAIASFVYEQIAEISAEFVVDL